MYARAIYDFMARNGQELTISKGDVVQVRLETCGRGSQDWSPWLAFFWSFHRW